MVEERRRVFSEWMAWRQREREDLEDEGGRAAEDEAADEEGYQGGRGEDGAVDVEEIVEEVLDEVEEVIGK